MFPYAHTKSISDMLIHIFAKSFHTTYLEVVYPPSDELVKFLHFVAVAYTPATTCEFLHPFLELRN